MHIHTLAGQTPTRFCGIVSGDRAQCSSCGFLIQCQVTPKVMLGERAEPPERTVDVGVFPELPTFYPKSTSFTPMSGT